MDVPELEPVASDEDEDNELFGHQEPPEDVSLLQRRSSSVPWHLDLISSKVTNIDGKPIASSRRHQQLIDNNHLGEDGDENGFGHRSHSQSSMAENHLRDETTTANKSGRSGGSGAGRIRDGGGGRGSPSSEEDDQHQQNDSDPQWMTLKGGLNPLKLQSSQRANGAPRITRADPAGRHFDRSVSPDDYDYGFQPAGQSRSNGGIIRGRSESPNSCNGGQSPRPPAAAAPQRPQPPPPPFLASSSMRPNCNSTLVPPPAHGLNDQLDNQRESSISSVTSLSSLLKEKLAVVVPKSLRNSKTPKQYKLKIFVILLFFVIAFFIGYAHVQYHNTVINSAYYRTVLFVNNRRKIKIFGDQSQVIFDADIGVTLPSSAKVYPCYQHPDIRATLNGGGATTSSSRMDEEGRVDGDITLRFYGDGQQEAFVDKPICLEWPGRAYLNLHKVERGPVKCYHFDWQSLDADFHPTDCISIQSHGVNWYGLGENNHTSWPLGTTPVPWAPFVTGNLNSRPWGGVLKRYLISSHGVAIKIRPEVPLHVAVGSEPGRRHQLCIKAQFTDFEYPALNQAKKLPALNYEVCLAENSRILQSALADKDLWDGMRKDDLEVVHWMTEEPLWKISPEDSQTMIRQESLFNYTDDILAHGFLELGYLLVDQQWQKHPGDLVMDPGRFSKMKEIADIIHRRGFRLALTIQPFISTESSSFKECVDQDLLARQKNSRVPAITSYGELRSAGMLDLTNNITKKWLSTKLSKLHQDINVDAFFLDTGTAFDIPLYYSFRRPLNNPDDLKMYFIKAVQEAGVNVIGVSGATERPKAPVFVALSDQRGTWDGLRKLVGLVLTVSTIGFPFLITGDVGGTFQELVKSGSNQTNVQNGVLDFDQELYIRWLQLAHFLPVVKYSHLPSELGPTVMEMARNLTRLRKRLVHPILEKYASSVLDTGLPLIRPLWLLTPNDANCAKVVDQFAIGEELLVAPIIHKNSFEREIYLPRGVWKDGIDESLRKGERWLHNYRVKLNQIAYFVKQPDGTRL